MVTCGSKRVNGETLQNNENKIQRKQIPPSVNSILQKGKLGHKGEQFTQSTKRVQQTYKFRQRVALDQLSKGCVYHNYNFELASREPVKLKMNRRVFCKF